MPWEVKIRSLQKGPLGQRGSLVESISAAVPAVDWIEEPPLLDVINFWQRSAFRMVGLQSMIAPGSQLISRPNRQRVGSSFVSTVVV